MDPTTGMFIIMDSCQGSIYNPVSLHKHLYVNVNSVTYIDSTGLTKDVIYDATDNLIKAKLVLETSEDGLKKIYSCAAKKMPAEMLMYLCNHTYLLDDYTDDVLRMLADSSYLPGVVYGMLEKYGDDFYRVYQRYGDDAIEVLSKHGDELFGLPESYRHEAIDLVMSYGDEVLEGIRKYGDDFMIRYANEGETFIQEYLEKGDEVFENATKPDAGSGSEGGSNIKIQEYIEDILDVSGTVDPTKMKDLRLAIQKGTFSKEEISAISKKMSELGITEVYEDAMKNIDFGTYLRNIVGEPPSSMINPHAHHILFKTGNGEAQQQLVKEGQEILRKYGIDPIVGEENLVWAPNAVTGQHDISALEKVVNGLKEIDEIGGDYDDIVNFLEDMGQIASSRG